MRYLIDCALNDMIGEVVINVVEDAQKGLVSNSLSNLSVGILSHVTE